MEQDKFSKIKGLNKKKWDQLRLELQALDMDKVEANGITLRPSQCYRLVDNSLRVMYNINCPETLRYKIESILSRYA